MTDGIGFCCVHTKETNKFIYQRCYKIASIMSMSYKCGSRRMMHDRKQQQWWPFIGQRSSSFLCTIKCSSLSSFMILWCMTPAWSTKTTKLGTWCWQYRFDCTGVMNTKGPYEWSHPSQTGEWQRLHDFKSLKLCGFISCQLNQEMVSKKYTHLWTKHFVNPPF